ncbi:hypothetical protein M0812_20021 [Anaeramoeba flamelloides]|uniref:Uncharacterized protein n=1 Tax=Anaeramoeba flamelloides TaxID=1746091 RepID=A0AAV7YWW5_9EUKA|nr:hypothetical protein M0812_20021 [Anaeramoeba flamelloides]
MFPLKGSAEEKQMNRAFHKLAKYTRKDYYQSQKTEFEEIIKDKQLQQICINLRIIGDECELIDKLSKVLKGYKKKIDLEKKSCWFTEEFYKIYAHIWCIKLDSVHETISRALKKKKIFPQKGKKKFNGNEATRITRNRPKKRQVEIKIGGSSQEKFKEKMKCRSESLGASSNKKPMIKKKNQSEPEKHTTIDSFMGNYKGYEKEKQVKMQEENVNENKEENSQNTMDIETDYSDEEKTTLYDRSITGIPKDFVDEKPEEWPKISFKPFLDQLEKNENPKLNNEWSHNSYKLPFYPNFDIETETQFFDLESQYHIQDEYISQGDLIPESSESEHSNDETQLNLDYSFDWESQNKY